MCEYHVTSEICDSHIYRILFLRYWIVNILWMLVDFMIFIMTLGIYDLSINGYNDPTSYTHNNSIHLY